MEQCIQARDALVLFAAGEQLCESQLSVNNIA